LRLDASLPVNGQSKLPFHPSVGPSSTSLAPGDIAFALYIVTVLFFGARLLVGWVLIRKLLSRALPTEYHDVYESPDFAVPVAAGLLKPKIVLPSEWQTWDRAKLAAVLVHERAHIHRHDPAVALFARLNRCVFWFHPLAWWLEHQLATLAEQACDDAVLSTKGNRQQYAGLLLELATAVDRSQGRIYRHAVGMASHVHKRVDRVLDERRRRHGLTPAIWTALLAASVPLLYAAGAVRIQRQPTFSELEFPRVAGPAVPQLVAQQRPRSSPQLQPRVSPPANPQLRISVTVTEPAGRYVTGLTSSNFRIFENGEERPVEAFYDNSPVSLAVVVNEDSDAVEALVPRLTLLHQELKPEDEMFIVYARGAQPELASSVEELLAITRKVAAGSSRNRPLGLDAVYLAADRLRTSRNSRRVLWAISTSTADDFSSHSEADAVAMARRADVIAYGGVPDPSRFAVEIHTQYVLAYTPQDPAAGGFQAIEVRLDHVDGMPPLTVRARQGYRTSP
jgi:hypothetical protein